MSFDESRFIFDAWNNYNGVVMEQGRVQLDSDWNEWLAELMRRIQAGTLDTLGRAVYPSTTPFAFQITATTDSGGTNHVNIGPGRMYVDGILAENHGAPPPVAVWDPALAELSGSPQPPGTTPTGTIDFTAQPQYPNAVLPTGNGPFAAYLDVWTRPITYLEDPTLVDAAVNVDTTGRLQTVWQVKLASVASGATCSSAEAAPPWPGPSIGQLTNGYAGSSASGPCCMTSGTGYTGMENQFYRIEIHEPGIAAAVNTYPAAAGTATFKWSRDNRSVETGVTEIQTVTNSIGNKAAQLSVFNLGRDQVLGFGPGNWIEILDDDLELLGAPGELHMIDTVDFSAKTITLVDLLQTPANFPLNSTNQTTASRHTRIRRWDQSGKVYATTATPGDTTLWIDLGITGSTGDIPVPPVGTTLIVESGITITFGPAASTQFNTGDFWTFSARASNGLIDPLTNAFPRGIHHHYAMLSIVSFSPNSNPDCRIEWPPSSGGSGSCCCTYTVGANAQYTSIQAAINALPDTGGEICILPGRYYENVFIENWDDVIIHGCGPQTRVASLALQPGYTAPTTPGGGTTPSTTMNAVFSVANSQDIQFRNFVVEAAPGEAGILIDGTGNLIAPEPGTTAGAPGQNEFGDVFYLDIPPVAEIVIEDMTITASTCPAIIAKQVTYLYVRDSRIAMANVRSTFPAVWMSGKNIEFVRNLVSLQTEANLNTWIPGIVFLDLLQDAKNAGIKLNESSNPRHPGGITIAGPSTDVLIAENQITYGLKNGITLGSYTILDANGNDTNITTGVAFAEESECTTTGSLTAPTHYADIQGSSVVASGRLVDVTITRNTISDFGLCGIGPVGYFDLTKTLEVVSVADLTITSNTITETVARALADDSISSEYAAAISLPTISDLIIRDNEIADFGSQPGVASGIFLLHGETAEISRNQIIDNRDWSGASAFEGNSGGGNGLGAITIITVTPPTLPSSKKGFAALAVFEPGLPALRMEENVVRVPLGSALEALGYGPFAISDNHFSCGGALAANSANPLQCVEILNMGTGIELIPASTPSQAYTNAAGAAASFNSDSSFASSNGGVLFTDNYCQLELRDSPQAGFASVIIASLDHITFSNNHCWLDAATSAETFGSQGMLADAFLLAGTVNAVGNRFQEAQYSVVLSAITFAVVNITNQNISTYCIFADGANVLSTGNLTIIDTIAPGTCAPFQWTAP